MKLKKSKRQPNKPLHIDALSVMRLAKGRKPHARSASELRIGFINYKCKLYKQTGILNKAKDIVPWVCNVCNGTFDTPNGGICKRCIQSACREHLFDLANKEDTDKRWVCDKCLTDKEKELKKKQNCRGP